MKVGFPPVTDAGTRLLILGSLPGDASLLTSQYYGHSRNAFWRLMDVILDADISGLPYDRKLTTLLDSGIGLWDVIAAADRKGSLDSAIRSPQTTDLLGLVATLPRLHTVVFNGGKAAKLGKRILAPHAVRLDMIVLPSSSPAHARPFTEKAAAWAKLRPLLGQTRPPLAPCGHMSRRFT